MRSSVPERLVREKSLYTRVDNSAGRGAVAFNEFCQQGVGVVWLGNLGATRFTWKRRQFPKKGTCSRVSVQNHSSTISTKIMGRNRMEGMLGGYCTVPCTVAIKCGR